MIMQKTKGVIALSLLSFSTAYADCQVFEHINYGGANFSMVSGQKISNVGSGWNDRISSVKTTNNCRLVAYQHVGYDGDKRVFASNTNWVGNLWNDQISSMQCLCPEAPKPACLMYEHSNFVGGVLAVYGNMPWVGRDWNDKVSSVKVPASCNLTIYQHKDYGGDSRVFGAGSTAYVGNLWNDKTSAAVCSCQ